MYPIFLHNSTIMKSKHHLFLFISFFLLTISHAQQDPHFSLYKYNMNILNPAYAGTNDGMEVLFGARSQWVGIMGAPETFNFNINKPIGQNIGLGFNAVADKVSVLSETHIYADFSYKIVISRNLDLFAGLKAGGSFLKVNLADLGIVNDPLFTENTNTFNPNFGVGFYLKASKYYITLSSPGFLKNTRFEKDGLVPVSAGDRLHMFLGGGYNISLNDRYWEIRSSTLLKIVPGTPMSWDVTASAWYANYLEFGVNYRIRESYTGFATIGLLDNLLRIGYAFENSANGLQRYGGTSHEIVLKLSL